MSWRRKWQPSPVFLPREFHEQRSLVGYSPWDHKESDTTEWLTLSVVSQRSHASLHPHQQWLRVLGAPHSHSCLLLSIFLNLMPEFWRMLKSLVGKWVGEDIPDKGNSTWRIRETRRMLYSRAAREKGWGLRVWNLREMTVKCGHMLDVGLDCE